MSIFLIIITLYGIFILIELFYNAIEFIFENIGSENFTPLVLSFFTLLWTIFYYSDKI